ncbi:PREDICTED: 16 kDa beta-galactoside-binding lectin-like [Gekko japonicus]|uniref:Galectin n=1 Tax=Gekko japonicus TaxID=146911 RepID=A0ABM1K9W9_GEKJA|nr:PREDICTED: 16 kDa beta-galactoside-binding lectin-like [Gekko japonicus]
MCQAFVMESQLIVVNLHSRKSIKVTGKVHSEAKSFALNLGSDGSNLLLHFNPRFDNQGDFRTIVCNSRQDREWGEAQRDDRFPFQQGEEAMIWISFDAKNMTVKMSEEHEIKFPNRLGLERIEFLSVDGDFKVQSIKID